jgi:hypothetical protein
LIRIRFVTLNLFQYPIEENSADHKRKPGLSKALSKGSVSSKQPLKMAVTRKHDAQGRGSRKRKLAYFCSFRVPVRVLSEHIPHPVNPVDPV